MNTSIQTPKKKITKAEYRQQLINRVKNQSDNEFNIHKAVISKNDPIISRVNKVLTAIK